MKPSKKLFVEIIIYRKLCKNLLVYLLLALTFILFQSPAHALQFESVTMRSMDSYKKFDGVTQNAVVIKATVERSNFFDRTDRNNLDA